MANSVDTADKAVSSTTDGSSPGVISEAALDIVLIVLGLILLATGSPSLRGDDFVRANAVAAFARHGTVLMMKYSFIGPFFSTPMWLFGRAVKSGVWGLTRFNFVLFVLFLAAIWFVLRGRVEGAVVRKFLLLLIAASMFPSHLLHFGAETFSAALVGVGLMAAAVRSSATGWGLAALGVANTPAAVIGLALAALKRMLDNRHLRYLLSVALAIVLILADTWLRQRTLANPYRNDHGVRTVLPYSGRPGFSYPLFFGLLSILFSFGKGLLFFAPGMLLPIRRKLRETSPAVWEGYALWLAFVIGLVLVYSKWWAWYGGNTWGPRFLLFASIPASFALAVRLQHGSERAAVNVLIIGVLALSLWVGVNGAVYGTANLATCVQQNYALEHLCWYAPEFSVLWRPFVVGKTLSLHDKASVAFAGIVFLRLAAPLIPATSRDARALWRRVRSRLLDVRAWRL